MSRIHPKSLSGCRVIGKCWKVVGIAVVCGFVLFVYLWGGKRNDETWGNCQGNPGDEATMHLALVACGNRLEEVITVIKSAVLFSIGKIKFHILAEDHLTPQLKKMMSEWPCFIRAKFQFDFYPITFPEQNNQLWRKLFRLCSAQRLFIPSILYDVDSLLYVDTDVVFLRPVDDIWGLLKSFNSTQLAAIGVEPNIPFGWYSSSARHPFYGVSGLNTGVMLMNLTRLRRTMLKNDLNAYGMFWEDLAHPLYQKYKNDIQWGEQDIINIIFHYNPEHVYALPCQWNYMSDHCTYGSHCQGAQEEGVSILHGNRGVFHGNRLPVFQIVYEAIRDFPFEDKTLQSLFYPMQTELLKTVNEPCGQIYQVFLKQIEKRTTQSDI
uniref:glucoside xylosyltransferase 2-like n=1 Tax=Doryrhamphus excisus TaxID=161450 RepID=UPI0025AE622A|nr:glucoside xylosyltransferase 2-like [Doryrhamphus excisus]